MASRSRARGGGNTERQLDTPLAEALDRLLQAREAISMPVEFDPSEADQGSEFVGLLSQAAEIFLAEGHAKRCDGPLGRSVRVQRLHRIAPVSASSSQIFLEPPELIEAFTVITETAIQLPQRLTFVNVERLHQIRFPIMELCSGMLKCLANSGTATSGSPLHILSLPQQPIGYLLEFVLQTNSFIKQCTSSCTKLFMCMTDSKDFVIMMPPTLLDHALSTNTETFTGGTKICRLLVRVVWTPRDVGQTAIPRQ
mmetsp:Transcript_107443/g.272632  ORF Transcript_107443/g.272632 Transcript_107443/m.272632 type:complete len:254 (+) Transcript_107443:237-998(+)